MRGTRAAAAALRSSLQIVVRNDDLGRRCGADAGCGGRAGVLGDFWSVAGSGWEWSDLSASASNVPSTRARHAMVASGEQLFLFGGVAAGAARNQTQHTMLRLLLLAFAAHADRSLRKRVSAQAQTQVADGGADAARAGPGVPPLARATWPRHGEWLTRCVGGCCVRRAACADGSTALQDLYAYEPATQTWTTLGAGGAPAARSDFQFAALDGVLYVHGGTLAGALAACVRARSQDRSRSSCRARL
eukprot:1166503-Rhodomonas_salina.1